MVEAAYSSGKPAYGVGAGNSSIVIDETADIEIAAQNTRISKTSDFGSGCSADGNIIIQKSIYEDMLKALIAEGVTFALKKKKTSWNRPCGMKRAIGLFQPLPALHNKQPVLLALRSQRTANF